MTKRALFLLPILTIIVLWSDILWITLLLGAYLVWCIGILIYLNTNNRGYYLATENTPYYRSFSNAISLVISVTFNNYYIAALFIILFLVEEYTHYNECRRDSNH